MSPQDLEELSRRPTSALSEHDLLRGYGERCRIPGCPCLDDVDHDLELDEHDEPFELDREGDPHLNGAFGEVRPMR